jgi:multidrug efflux system membrane fusion protein
VEAINLRPRSIGVTVSLVCAVGLAAWLVSRGAGSGAAQPAAATPPTIPITAGVANRQDVPNEVEALGTVQSIDSVSVVPRVIGQIQQVFFTPGQDVKQGQPLFLIDPRPYQAALDQAAGQLAHDQAVLKEAQTDLERYQGLAKTNAIPKQQAQDQLYVVEQDQGTVELDRANVETAKLNLAYCHISAPISGRTGSLLVDLGNNIQTTTTTPLVSITKLQPIYVSFTVPQTLITQIRDNQAKAPLGVSALTQAGKPVATGKLTLIDNEVNGSADTIMLQGTFANRHDALWPGEFVRARLKISTLQNVITVPQSSVLEGPDGTYVYVIEQGDSVRRRSVHVAVRQSGIAVIDKGLSGGERVVTDGQYRLTNNAKVKIQAAAKPG